MKLTSRRIIAFLITVLMVTQMLPLGVLAESQPISPASNPVTVPSGSVAVLWYPDEPTPPPTGLSITVSWTGGNPQTQNVTAANNWTAAFPANVPPSGATGVAYTLNGIDPSAYKVYDSEVFTGGGRVIPVSAIISTPVEKTWLGTHGKERAEVEILLSMTSGYAGETGGTGTVYDSITGFVGDPNADDPFYTVSGTFNFPSHNSDGKPFHTLKFHEEKFLNATTVSLSGEKEYKPGETIHVYNTVTRNVSVNKVWAGDEFGQIRQVTFRLLNITTGASSTETAQWEPLAGWQPAIFQNIQMGGEHPAGSGNYIAYEFEVQEVLVDGRPIEELNYKPTVTGNTHDGFIVSNTPVVPDDKIGIIIEKTWDDAINKQESAYSEFTITCLNDPLFNGGEPYVMILQRNPNDATTLISRLLITEEYVLNPFTETETDVKRQFLVTELTQSNSNFMALQPIITTNGKLTTYHYMNIVNNISLTAEKVWTDGNPEGLDARATLYRRDSRGGTEQVKNDIGNPYIILFRPDPSETGTGSIPENLGKDWPRFDRWGNEYIYYIVEEQIPSGYSSVTNGMTLVNTPDEAADDENAIVVIKSWDKNGKLYNAPFPAVTLELYRVNTPNDDVLVDRIFMPAGYEYNVVRVIRSADLDPNATYYIKELGGNPNWTVSFSTGNNGQVLWSSDHVGTVVITNTLTGDIDEPLDDFIDIYVSKKWDLINPLTLSGQTATFDLFAVGRGMPGGLSQDTTRIGGSGAILYDDKGQAVITIQGDNYILLRLPAYDDNGIRYVYNVDEHITENFDVTDKRTQNAYEFTNREKRIAGITLEKVWEGISALPTGYNLGTLTFTLQRSVNPEDPDSWISLTPQRQAYSFTADPNDKSDPKDRYLINGTIQAFPPQPQLVLVDGVYKQAYYRVVETSSIGDFILFVKKGNGVVGDGVAYIGPGEDKASFVNTYDPLQASISVRVQKNWIGSGTGRDYPDVRVQLFYEDGGELKPAYDRAGNLYIMEIAGGPESKTTYQDVFPNVPINREGADGKPILNVYHVVETAMLVYNPITDEEEWVDIIPPYSSTHTPAIPVYDHDGTLLRTYRHTGNLKMTSYFFTLSNNVDVPFSQRRFTFEAYKVWGPDKLAEPNEYKSWIDYLGEDTAYQIPSVTFALFRNNEIIAGANGECILGDNNEWHYTFDDLLINDPDGKPYTYNLVEINPPAGYFVDIYKAAENYNGGRYGVYTDATLRNTPIEGEDFTRGVEFVKAFTGDAGYLGLRPSTGDSIFLTVSIFGMSGVYRIEMKYDETTGAWRAVQELPAGYVDADNNFVPYTYVVAEDGINGYNFTAIGADGTVAKLVTPGGADKMFTIDRASAPDASGKVTVTNEMLNEVNVVGRKMWKDSGSEDYRPSKLTVTLQRAARTEDAEPADSAYYNVPGYIDYIVDSGDISEVSVRDNIWLWTIYNLPRFGEGGEYVYRWLETIRPVNYEIENGTAAANSNEALTNEFTPISLEVTKEWDLDGIEENDTWNPIPASIWIELTRGVIGATGFVWDESFVRYERILTGANTCVFTDLAEGDANGNPYTYRISGEYLLPVDVVDPAAYILAYGATSASEWFTVGLDAIPITNTADKTGVSGIKIWAFEDEDMPDPLPEVLITVIGKVHLDEETEIAVYQKTVALNDDNTFNIDNLPKYHFINNDAYKIAYEELEESGEGALKFIMTYTQADDGAFTVTNTPIPPKSHKWVDGKEKGDPVYVGEVFTYVIDYDAPEGTSTVTIIDMLPPEVEYRSSTPPATIKEDGTLEWIITDASGPIGYGSVSITVKLVEMPEGEKLHNEATVWYDDEEEEVEDDRPVLDRRSEKTAEGTKAHMKPGDTFSYVISYEAPEGTQYVVIKDLLPAEVKYESSMWNDVTYGNYDPVDHTVVWILPELDPDEPSDLVGQVSITVTILSVPEDEILHNEGTVTYRDFDGKEVIDEVEHDLPVEEKWSKKTLNGENIEPIKLGDTFSYRIEYNPPQGVPVKEVKITDRLPDELEYVSGGSYTAGPPRTVVWTIEPDEADGFVEPGFVILTVKLTAMPADGKLHNEATVSYDGDDEEVDDDRKVYDAYKYVDEKDEGESVELGETFTYVIAYEAPKGTTQIKIKDELPIEVEYVSGGSYSLATHTVEWTIDVTDATPLTGSVTVQVKAIAVPADNKLLNKGTVTFIDDDGEKEVDVDDDRKVYTAYKYVKEYGKGIAVELYEEFTYVIAYEAPEGTTQIIITDELPAEVTYEGSDPEGVYTQATHTIVWTLNVP
ncbi:MAG: Cna B-type domain-containing protein, partial [Clostridia bacterium]|nr:Cna B-type domain-containing protein [Clostridia bacterium]